MLRWNEYSNYIDISGTEKSFDINNERVRFEKLLSKNHRGVVEKVFHVE